MLLVWRKSDGKDFAMKFTNPKNGMERQDVINECSLIKHLNCDQLISAEEVFDFSGRIFAILEIMEGGSVKDIIRDYMGDLSENFVRWTLF